MGERGWINVVGGCWPLFLSNLDMEDREQSREGRQLAWIGQEGRGQMQ